MSTLRNRYLTLDSDIQEGKILVPDEIKMRLYGLSKQLKEGDCKMPMPPSSNELLRSKWDSWMTCSGMTTADAANEFIKLVEDSQKINTPINNQIRNTDYEKTPPRDNNDVLPSERSSLAPLSKRKSEFSSLTSPHKFSSSDMLNKSMNGSQVRKQGILYKKRDYIAGWRPRYFVLQDSFLHYFINEDDPAPKKTIDVSGSIVTADMLPVTTTKGGTNGGVIELYSFTLSHYSSETYHLAADSSIELNAWVDKLREAAKDSNSVQSSSTVENRKMEKESKDNSPRLSSLRESIVIKNMVQPEETLYKVPIDMQNKLDECVRMALEYSKSDASGWELLYEKNGVTAKKLTASEIICVKGTSVMPYSVLEVFTLITNHSRFNDLDSNINTTQIIHMLSNNLNITYRRYNPVWPTAPREFVYVQHWRLLLDGTVLIITYSDFDALQPVFENAVRGHVHVAAYVLCPTPEGAVVTFIVKTDLKGTIPKRIVNYASDSQPMIVGTIRKVLEADRLKSPSTSSKIDKSSIPTFEELCQAVKDGQKSANFNKKIMKTDLSTIESYYASSSSNVPSNASNKNPPGNNSKKVNSNGTDKSTNRKSMNPSTTKSSVSIVNQKFHTAVTQDPKKSKLNQLAWLILCLPLLLYYIVDKYNGIAFMVGLVIAINYLVRLHLGEPRFRDTYLDLYTSNMNSLVTNHSSISSNSSSSNSGSSGINKSKGSPVLGIISHFIRPPKGRHIIHFPVELGKLLRYLDMKREEFGLEITLSHVNLKACALVFAELPELKGYIALGQFYPSAAGSGVDMSISYDLSEKETIMIKMEDVAVKPIEMITNEIKSKGKLLRTARFNSSPTNSRKVLQNLPGVIKYYLEMICRFLGSGLGMSIPWLGISKFPLGMCCVMTSPSFEGEMDIDVVMDPDNSFIEGGAPITVSIGGIKVFPTIDTEKKVMGSPALNYCISIDSRAASIAESRKFCSKLQYLLNNPTLIDKGHNNIINNSLMENSRK